MTRKYKTVPANESLIELLVGLQLDEKFSVETAPEWAAGTSVEEIFQALRILGDGAWLEGRYEGFGVYDSADRWLSDFFMGKPVPIPEDYID